MPASRVGVPVTVRYSHRSTAIYLPRLWWGHGAEQEQHVVQEGIVGLQWAPVA